MGKGDKRSRRGKIFAGSFGKTRLKPKKAAFVAPAKEDKPVVKRQRKPVITKAKAAEETEAA